MVEGIQTAPRLEYRLGNRLCASNIARGPFDRRRQGAGQIGLAIRLHAAEAECRLTREGRLRVWIVEHIYGLVEGAAKDVALVARGIGTPFFDVAGHVERAGARETARRSGSEELLA